MIEPPGTLTARRLGFRELTDMAALGLRYPRAAVATSRTFIRERPAPPTERPADPSPSAPVKTPATELVSELRREIDRMLGPLFPRGSSCALLDFPNYPNVGDSAIWLGTMTFLSGRSASVRYACDAETYAPDRLASRLRGGTLLLTGGGNLGDLWPHHQHFRESVIARFPDHRIIQLPQTIWFRDPANLARARAIFDRHPDLTLFVRDNRSLEFARNEFRAPSVLCPDMAFALGPLPRRGRPGQAIAWLSRTDLESAAHDGAPSPAGIAKVDWVQDRPSLVLRAHETLHRQIGRHPRALRRLIPALRWMHEPLARQRLRRGCRLLCGGRVVITDRLHGHILSLLLGIPHVLLDNSYGKVKGFYDTWTSGSELTFWAASPEEAFARAAALLDDVR